MHPSVYAEDVYIMIPLHFVCDCGKSIYMNERWYYVEGYEDKKFCSYEEAVIYSATINDFEPEDYVDSGLNETWKDW